MASSKNSNTIQQGKNEAKQNATEIDTQDFQIPGVEIIRFLGEGADGAAYQVRYEGNLVCAKLYENQNMA